MAHLILQGMIIGLSVAWPPGPINAEILRRGISGQLQGGIAVGIGACLGDFVWALAVISGIGWLAQVAWFHTALVIISGCLLAWLSTKYLRQAWQNFKNKKSGAPLQIPAQMRKRTGLLLGIGLALSSPWNISFWIAVIGQQAITTVSTPMALIFATSVLAGSLIWMLIYGTAIRFGARFANHWWQIGTQMFTGCLMLFFLIRLVATMMPTS